MWQQGNAQKYTDSGQELWTMKKCELQIGEPDGLGILPTANLPQFFFSHTGIYRVKKKRMVCRVKHLADERSERMTRLVWAGRKSIVTQTSILCNFGEQKSISECTIHQTLGRMGYTSYQGNRLTKSALLKTRVCIFFFSSNCPVLMSQSFRFLLDRSWIACGRLLL